MKIRKKWDPKRNDLISFSEICERVIETKGENKTT
jgi:hypothetical protein